MTCARIVRPGVGSMLAALLTVVSAFGLTIVLGSPVAHAAPGPSPVIVRAFDHANVSFTSTDNRRTITAPASFPATGDFSRITMHLRLDCPRGGCDPWDRYGTVGVVTSPAVGVATSNSRGGVTLPGHQLAREYQ